MSAPMPDLLDKPRDEPRIDWMIEFAKSRYGAPPQWQWFRWERKEFGKPHEFIIVEGAVCTETYKQGKQKGFPNWAKRDKATEIIYSVKRSELEALQREWEIETGKCYECCGTGSQVAGWSAVKGTRYRTCTRCDGLGRLAITTGAT